MVNLNRDSVIYQATVKLEDLAVAIADSRSKKKLDRYLDQAATILNYLTVLLSYEDYIEDSQINNILQCLIDLSQIQDFPVTPNLPTLTVPDTGTTIVIQGTPGPSGQDGGGTDFSIAGATTDIVVDSFAVSSANGAHWNYVIEGAGLRAGTVYGVWTDSGSATDGSDSSTPDVSASTAAVTFTVDFNGGNIRLLAHITSGTWSISGTRYFHPNNGAGVTVANSPLANGSIFIGNASNVPTAQAVTGDVLITSGGVTSIATSAIINTDVNPSAAIAVTKLATLPNNSSAVVSDSSGYITTVSGVSTTEVGYLSGVTSDIQTQLDSKVSATGAISTVVTLDLTPDRAVVSNPAGKIAVSGTTSTELGYVGGVTSAIQTQINTKQATITGGATTVTSSDLTASRILISNGAGKIAVSAVSSSILTSDVVHTFVNIGTWDMNGTPAKSTAHGLSDHLKIRSVYVVILKDDGTTPINLERPVCGDAVNGGAFVPGGTIYNSAGQVTGWDATNINMVSAPLFFVGADYDSGAVNRGYITITSAL